MTGDSSLRRLSRLGGSWQEAIGYRHAIRTGERIVVRGGTVCVDGAAAGKGDAGGQLRLAPPTVLDVLTAAGGTLGDAIRTPSYVADRAESTAVGRAHRGLRAGVRSAATMALAIGLLEQEAHVEVEVEVEARARSARSADQRGFR